VDLENLKKEPSSLLRLSKGMATLPELKERVVNYRTFLADLIEIKKKDE